MSTLQDRFGALLERHVHGFTIRGSRATGLCPFHQERTPSFSAHLVKCVFYCFGCGASGGVRKFAELVGEPWGHIRSESGTAKAHRLALVSARGAFARWSLHKVIALTDEYRGLMSECEIIEIAYRASHRRFDLYSKKERAAWTCRLSEIYDRLAILEYVLDVLTFKKRELECLQWWREEERGQLAA